MKTVISSTELIPGTKVGLEALVSDAAKEKLKLQKAYYSEVYDVNDDHSVEIFVPYVDGKLTALLQKVKYGVIFTTKDGLYRGIGEVSEHYKKENFYIYHLELQTKLERYQRREFYRLNVLLPLYFITLDDRAATLDSMKDLRTILTPDKEHFPDFVRTMGNGSTDDISGGGIKFHTEKEIPKAKYILLKFRLESEHLNEEIEIIGEIVGSYKNENSVFYTYRIKFHFKDSKFQEKIVQYIFDKERLLRKKAQD
jgi:c-di-GMP-binding flagellar brake protein YcgR